MSKRTDCSSDVFAIAMFAPLVIGARLQMLSTEAVRPTAMGRREAGRMLAEKPAALIKGAFAAQRSMADSGLKLWSNMALAANAFALTAPALSTAAATAPVRQRVRSNARRLTRI